ncbi:MAG TPA: protein kinase [Candidatus Krumholzibacteria bacterium]|nr:protein kinase [Candidatus Krumholzibacteria bacterium]
MSLTPGSKLGIYEIVAPLGAGGMGEVYRARDTKLGRDVAIKALPPQFAQDPDRLSRFEREAKLLASLTHPHIAGIFGLEDIDAHRYLVLEFVEGETLAQRLDHGTLSIDESLHICRQIASALESAHENGIAHRDLKPGNVMLTPAGDVKVLDFGLAKGGMGSGSSPSDISMSHSPTLTHQHTGAGVILGTAAYMSPEQARGRTVDKRTDIWSFGCVLYECLTGRQAFAGDTVSDLIARILEREPDWDALPSRTPQRIRDLLKRCLEKDARQRLRDIGDARIEIDNVIATKSSNPEAVAAAAAAHKSRTRVRTIAGALALVAVTAAATYFGAPRTGAPASLKPVRLEIPQMPGTHMADDGVESAVSPDGSMVAYSGMDSAGVVRIWLRPLESIVARVLPGTENATQPFWSPDSRYIGFFKGATSLMKVAVNGGAPENVTSIKGPRGGTWNRDGVILYAPFSEGPIYRVSANGGDGVAVTTLDSTESAHRYPVFLPDGSHFLYTALPPHDARYRIYMASLDGKEKKLVTDAAWSGAVYASGYLLYERDGVVVAQRFDPGSGRVSGEPTSLGDRVIGTGFSGAAGLSAANNGVLTYTTNPPFSTHLVWTDMQGRKISDVPMTPGKYIGLELSPDETQAVLESSPRIGKSDLWLADLERGVVTRLSYEDGENTNARWSPDGTRVAFTSGSIGGYEKIVVVNVNGGAQKTYLDNVQMYKNISGWTPDGKALVFGLQNPKTRWDIWILPLDGDAKPKVFLQTPYFEDRAKVSPDGRWILYRSNESGQYDIYVQSFPDGGKKYKVTTNGGNSANWARDGHQLYVDAAGAPETAVADVLPGPEFHLGPMKPFARGPEDAFDGALGRNNRLLVLVPSGALPAQSITIVQNWPALLGRK